jgi:hypothetical protein
MGCGGYELMGFRAARVRTVVRQGPQSGNTSRTALYAV